MKLIHNIHKHTNNSDFSNKNRHNKAIFREK